MSALSQLRAKIISINVRPAIVICTRNSRHDPKHPETPAPGEYEITPRKGRPTDKKPFPMELKAGKTYFWCTCGESHNQPLCDGSHKTKKRAGQTHDVKFLPHKFTVEETKQYWICMCKQTDNRPFCDGHHLDEKIQQKFR